MPRTKGLCAAAALLLAPDKSMVNNTGALLNGVPVPMCNFDAEAGEVQWNPLGPDGSTSSSTEAGYGGGDLSSHLTGVTSAARLNAVCVNEPTASYSTSFGTQLEIGAVADGGTGVMIEIKVMSTRTVAPKLASRLLGKLFGWSTSYYHEMSQHSVLFHHSLAGLGCRDYTYEATPSGPSVPCTPGTCSVAGSVCARHGSQLSPIIVGVTTNPERATCCLGYRGSESFPSQ